MDNKTAKKTNKTKKSNTKSKAKSKTGAKKSTTKSKAKKTISFYEKNRFAIMLAYFGVAILLSSLAFIDGNGVWAILRQTCYATFGLGFLVMIALIISTGLKIAFNKLEKSLLMTNIFSTFMVISTSSLIQIIKSEKSVIGFEQWWEQVKLATSYGWKIEGISGGLLGALFGDSLVGLTSKIPALILMFLLLVISIIFYSNHGFNYVGMRVAEIMNKRKEKFDDKVKVKRESLAKKMQEKQRLRLENETLEDENDEDTITYKRQGYVASEPIGKDKIFVGSKRKIEEEQEEKEEKILVENTAKKQKKGTKDSLFTYVISDEEKDLINNMRRKRNKSLAENEAGSNIDINMTENEANFNHEVANGNISANDDDLTFGDAIEQQTQDENAKPIVNPFLKKEAESTETVSSDDQEILQSAIDKAKSLAEMHEKNALNSENEHNENRNYCLPPLECLNEPKFKNTHDFTKEMRITSKKLLDSLKSFNVDTKLIGISHGPSVTRYELQPALGVKIKKITGLADDIALSLAASGVRIEAPIPGKAAVGIEIPNKNRETVTLREIISSQEFKKVNSKLNVALGRDISGEIACADLAKMPHLLIAGTTGSGKSVCLNSMITSILYNATSEEVKMLMIDPKQVEMTVYNGIPHLLVPVISDIRKAAGSLAWAVGEMENRYKMFSTFGVRGISGFNKLVEKNPEMQPMPQIVIFIDELNDLMMLSPKEVEDSICRLAQKARAAGMHLVVATQRPSVDVITGLIKSNIPSRIALSVSSQIDSRTILDGGGAEKLLGNGDMLFSPVGNSKPVRIQGAFLSDEEIENVVTFIKEQENAHYDDEIMQEIEKNAVVEKKKGSNSDSSDASSDLDTMFEAALEVVVECESASTSLLQRRLKLGYARAARIMDQLYDNGIIGPPDGSKPRKVMVTPMQLQEMKAMAETSQDE